MQVKCSECIIISGPVTSLILPSISKNARLLAYGSERRVQSNESVLIDFINVHFKSLPSVAGAVGTKFWRDMIKAAS